MQACYLLGKLSLSITRTPLVWIYAIAFIAWREGRERVKAQRASDQICKPVVEQTKPSY